MSVIMGTAIEPKSEPVLYAHANRFDNLLADQRDFISAIQNKIHDLYNKRTPQTDAAVGKLQSMSDFYERMDSNLDALAGNNESLRKILDHLS